MGRRKPDTLVTRLETLIKTLGTSPVSKNIYVEVLQIVGRENILREKNVCVIETHKLNGPKRTKLANYINSVCKDLNIKEEKPRTTSLEISDKLDYTGLGSKYSNKERALVRRKYYRDLVEKAN